MDKPIPNRCPLCEDFLKKEDLERIFESEVPPFKYDRSIMNFYQEKTNLKCC